MITASTRRKPAAANIPTPVPPAFRLTFSSDFASSISLEINVEMSRLASVTRRPMVGSSACGCAGTGSVAMSAPPGLGSVWAAVLTLPNVTERAAERSGRGAERDRQGLALPRVGDDEHLVAGPQLAVAMHGQQPLLAHDEADPGDLG